MVSEANIYIGPTAGIVASLLWTATALFFTAAGQRLGPTVVNALRIIIAVVLLGFTHKLFTGLWIPQATPSQVMFLAASGIVGLAIGDQALFTAFVDIGPRISMLIMTTSPLFAALFGWMALGERISLIGWIGMAITIAGVAWVVNERPEKDTDSTVGVHRTRGIVLAFVGGACQAGGLMLSKQGIGHGVVPLEQHIDPQTATFIRMFFAGIAVLPMLLIQIIRQRKQLARIADPFRVGTPRAGLAFMAMGAVAGPYLGVWMSLVASDRASLGVAQTLCSLTPVFILPVLAFGFKQRISLRSVLGALVAVAGSTLLFFYPQ